MQTKYLSLFVPLLSFSINSEASKLTKEDKIKNQNLLRKKKTKKNKANSQQKREMQKAYNKYEVNVNNIIYEYYEKLNVILEQKEQAFVNEIERNDNIQNKNNDNERAELLNLYITYTKDIKLYPKKTKQIEAKYLNDYVKIVKKYNAIQKKTAMENVQNINNLEKKYNQIEQALKVTTNNLLENERVNCLNLLDAIQSKYHKKYYKVNPDFIDKKIKNSTFLYKK